jgi:hypothetical protein
MFNFTDCFELLTPRQQMNFHYEFKRLRGEDVYEKRFAYDSFDHPKDMLASAFLWDDTSQGFEYWGSIYREIVAVMDILEYSTCPTCFRKNQPPC